MKYAQSKTAFSKDLLSLATSRFTPKDWDWLSRRLLLYADRTLRDKEARMALPQRDRLKITSRVIKEFLSGKVRFNGEPNISKKELREVILVKLAFMIEESLRN